MLPRLHEPSPPWLSSCVCVCVLGVAPVRERTRVCKSHHSARACADFIFAAAWAASARFLDSAAAFAAAASRAARMAVASGPRCGVGAGWGGVSEGTMWPNLCVVARASVCEPTCFCECVSACVSACMHACMHACMTTAQTSILARHAPQQSLD